MEEQVELDFVIKAPVTTMQSLVEMLNHNHLVEILSVTDGSKDRELAGPVFLSIPDMFPSSPDRWEYMVSSPPTHTYQAQDFENWLNAQGAAGWEIMIHPKDASDWWYFKRKLR